MNLIPEFHHAGGTVGPDCSHSTLLVQQCPLRVGSTNLCSHVAIMAAPDTAYKKAPHFSLSTGENLANLGFKALGELHTHPSFNAVHGHTPAKASPPCLATGNASAGRIKQRRSCGTPHCSRDDGAVAADISAPTDLGAGGWAHFVARGATCFPARAVQRPRPRAPLGAPPRRGCARPGYLLRRPRGPHQNHRPHTCRRRRG